MISFHSSCKQTILYAFLSNRAVSSFANKSVKGQSAAVTRTRLVGMLSAQLNAEYLTGSETIKYPPPQFYGIRMFITMFIKSL